MKLIEIYSTSYVFNHEGIIISLLDVWLEEGWHNYDYFYADDSTGKVELTRKRINELIDIARKDYPELLL